ncbi:TauD/TfdA family dioxygenase [Mucilaginibacter sp. 21P]|uniref:TauD/TfdA family dioxygenase n=1 Tax=Mucilaginibacter sp. 21P TaxID=2778902 RepID=UPI001C5A3AA3|nr:TauD/TfdA family dioxygenase [Mucilaginibacter sp. 21P]QXV63886.1 TauD/TfdA family dioxygenase [Mucilaginibacter sp. 21P]
MKSSEFTGAPLKITTRELPLTVQFDETIQPEELIVWLNNNRVSLEDQLLQYGAVRLKNTAISSVHDFDRLIAAISIGEPMAYVDGFSPRTKLTSNTYTSTEYDADFNITLHNELSYSAKWPSKLIFCCITPCETGGETTIADCRKILTSFNTELLAELREKGVRYVRNLHSGEGAGPSWQQTYETDSRHYVEQFCRDSDIRFDWKDDGGIRLVQHRPAVIRHPLTNEEVWFNQVDQFHPSHMDEEIYEALMMMYENEMDLPMYGSFGDGSSISTEKIQAIRKTVDSNIVKNRWEKGDLLIVDNVLVCHGRSSYTGNRKILVSMT